MKKGISPVLAVVLVLLVSIALAGTFLAWSQQSVGQLTETGTEESQEFAQGTTEGIEILSIACDSVNEITIRNSGSTTYHSSNITVFRNDNIVSATWSPSADLSPDDIATTSSVSMNDGDNIRVVTPRGARDSSVC